MAPEVVQASVFLNDRYVGVLNSKGGRASFRYEDFVPDHPTLGLRFEYDPDYGSAPETSVPSWFANLLPERESGLWQFYSRRLGASYPSDFLLLMYLGNDLPGAVRVQAEGKLPARMTEVLDAARLREGRRKISFSLSGMQLKFSMCEKDGMYSFPEPGELGDWIVKLPSDVYPEMPANEYGMMTWASMAGISVPEHRLEDMERLKGLPEDVIDVGKMAFAVRRFDRTPTGRVHQEDFAQVLDVIPAAKDRGTQESVGRVIAQECPEDDFWEYLRRLVFCVVAGNTDEHLKNWSLRYPDTHAARISPAYDLVAVTAYQRFRRDKLTLSIAGLDDTEILRIAHFQNFAESLGVDGGKALSVVEDTLDKLRATWPIVSSDPRVPEYVRTHIDHRIEHLELMK